MHPTIVIELAAARQADLLRVAEDHRRARLARPAHRRVRPSLSSTAPYQRLRSGAALLFGQGTARHSDAAVCCA